MVGVYVIGIDLNKPVEYLYSSLRFFDENEFNDLSNYMEDEKKKSWF